MNPVRDALLFSHSLRFTQWLTVYYDIHNKVSQRFNAIQQLVAWGMIWGIMIWEVDMTSRLIRFLLLFVICYRDTVVFLEKITLHRDQHYSTAIFMG